MRSVSHVRLLLLPPKHGWLPVRFELDDFIVDDAASNVLNDPVAERMDLLPSSVAPALHGPCVCFWLEPDGYAIDVLRASAPFRSVLRTYYDSNFVPPMQTREMSARFECEVETQTLSSALLAGLAELLDGPSRPNRVPSNQPMQRRARRSPGRAGAC
jgi:hypothetical protein